MLLLSQAEAESQKGVLGGRGGVDAEGRGAEESQQHVCVSNECAGARHPLKGGEAWR